MFVEALYTLLSGSAGIRSALGQRPTTDSGIFPNIAPDEVKLPYIVYTHIARGVIRSYQGVNKMQSMRMQLSCYGGSYKTAKSLGDAVKLALDGFTGVLAAPDGSYFVGETIPNSEHDELEEAFKATLYGVVLDYEFWVTVP